jgi:hypothetical protein
MREFAKKSRLALLPLSARLVYSVFLGFTLLGLLVSAWLGETSVGLDLGKFDAYYAGAPVVSAQPALAADTGGPTFDLPEEVNEPPQPEPKSFRSTLEVTHFHLFTMPIHWLVLAHLFALCGISERAKVVFITGSALAMASHLAAPWIARQGGSFGKLFYAGSGILLLVTFGWMAVAALIDMWRSSPSKTPATTE